MNKSTQKVDLFPLMTKEYESNLFQPMIKIKETSSHLLLFFDLVTIRDSVIICFSHAGMPSTKVVQNIKEIIAPNIEKILLCNEKCHDVA